MKKVAILCADIHSSYFQFPECLIYTARENALTYNGDLPAICHPPCNNYSKARNLSKQKDTGLELAKHCLHIVKKNSGIIEQPANSILFSLLNITPTIEVWQSWFGFRAKKRTWLYCWNIKLLPTPISFNAPTHNVERLTSSMRARQTPAFSEWLINSVLSSQITA